MNYKNIVNQIMSLKWANLSEQELHVLVVFAGYCAREFAESLRIALELYPESEGLKKMALEELNTTNLQFEDYKGPGDHADFLWHFIRKYNLVDGCGDAVTFGEQYLARVRALPREVRAMSIFSREAELPGMFVRTLEAKNWSAVGLPSFRYYLERHIALDSADDGHAALVSDFKLDDRLSDFYQARLDAYQCLPNLF
jgi:hypothetical protein